MTKSTISILGSGWLGLPLAESLLAKNYTVKLSTKTKEKLPQLKARGFDSYLVDIDQALNASDVFFQSDTLIINITSKNIEGFKSLIDKIENSSIKKIIFISSTSVYPMLNTSVSESDGVEKPEHPLYIIENLFRNHQKFKTTVIRFAGLIDQRRHPGKFFTKKPCPNASAPVNLIHLEDCINILEAVLSQDIWNEVFNACASLHPSKKVFYTAAAKAINAKPPLFNDPLLESKEAEYKIIDNSKIKRLLNYQFKQDDLLLSLSNDF